MSTRGGGGGLNWALTWGGLRNRQVECFFFALLGLSILHKADKGLGFMVSSVGCKDYRSLGRP